MRQHKLLLIPTRNNNVFACNNLQLCHQHQEDQLHQDLQAHPVIHNKTGNPIKRTSLLGGGEGDDMSLVRIKRPAVSHNERNPCQSFTYISVLAFLTVTVLIYLRVV